MAEGLAAVESDAVGVGEGVKAGEEAGAAAPSAAGAGASRCSVAAKITAAAMRKIAPKRIGGHGLDGDWFSGSGGSGAMMHTKNAQRLHK